MLLKELTTQLKVEEKSYEAFAVKIVGGDRPAIVSLSASIDLRMSFAPSFCTT